MTPIAEWRGVDPAKFADEIATQYRPAVLRGLVEDWPAVASAKGRIFYNENLTGFNFTRNAATITAVVEQLLRYATFDNRPMLAVQSALIADCLPGFGPENRLDILDPSIAPRVWLGNRVVTPAHFDESSNIACVVSGHRPFTLFPPEQIANLYVGPLDYAPTDPQSAAHIPGHRRGILGDMSPDFRRQVREFLAKQLEGKK